MTNFISTVTRKASALLAVAAFLALTLTALFAMASAASAQTCDYNSDQSSCACPASGGGTTCFGNLLYRSTDSTCQADSRPCAANQLFSCSSVSCVCNTTTHPCGGCTEATSTPGGNCSAPNGGRYTDQCGACGCAIGSTLCSSSNTCVIDQECPTGSTWNPCTAACENPYVLISPSGQQDGAINVTGDVATGGDVYMVGGKALRVDGVGVTILNIGNWGSGASGFSMNVAGGLAATGALSGGSLTVTSRVTSPEICLNGSCLSAWPGGLSSISAGTGVSVTNPSGPVPTIAADFSAVQTRVSQSCLAGSSIRAIAANGTVTCETDDAGTGAIGQCGAGSSIRIIAANGAVTCEPDDTGTAGNSFSTIGAGSGFATADSSADSLTLVSAQSVLLSINASDASDSVTFSLNTSTGLQERVDGVCASGQKMTGVNANGTVVCSAPTDVWVNTTGDTMTGALSVGSTITSSGSITSGGRLYANVNGTSLQVLNDILITAGKITLGSSGGVGWSIGSAGSSGSDYMWFNDVNGNNRVRFTRSGLYAEKPSGGSWGVLSDLRLKDRIVPYERGLDAIMALQPIRYHYKGGAAAGLVTDAEPEHVGFGAQDVMKVIPEAVYLREDGYFGFNADPVLWTMTNAIKELKRENDALRESLSSLEERLEALEAANR